MNIRIAQKADLEHIVDIYNQAIRSRSATGDMDEFTIEDRIGWFDKHDPLKYPLYVAETDNKLVGYGSLSPYRPNRRAMDKVAEVSFFVDYQYHNKGIGSKMLTYIMSHCNALEIDHLIAVLLDINKPSIALLEKQGFKKWGHLPEIIHFEDITCGHLYYGVKISGNGRLKMGDQV